MLDRMSDTSRIVDKLVLKKYVDRMVCPNDRRQVNLLISDKGLELLKELDFIDKQTTNICKNLSEKEVQQLNNLLDKLRD
jgi:DNA-binding MarR family transcriptional regulator